MTDANATDKASAPWFVALCEWWDRHDLDEGGPMVNGQDAFRHLVDIVGEAREVIRVEAQQGNADLKRQLAEAQDMAWDILRGFEQMYEAHIPCACAHCCVAIPDIAQWRKAIGALNQPAQESDLSKCPGCGGPADNGHDRELPPNPYLCSKCEKDTTTMKKNTGGARSDVGACDDSASRPGTLQDWQDRCYGAELKCEALTKERDEAQKNLGTAIMRLADFIDYFAPRGGVSDVPLGPFERAIEDFPGLVCGQKAAPPPQPNFLGWSIHATCTKCGARIVRRQKEAVVEITEEFTCDDCSDHGSRPA